MRSASSFLRSMLILVSLQSDTNNSVYSFIQQNQLNACYVPDTAQGTELDKQTKFLSPRTFVFVEGHGQ